MQLKTLVRFGLGLAIAAGIPSVAFSYCIEPTEPGCISYKIAEWDDHDFERCRAEVAGFVREMSNWQDCIVSEVNRRVEDGDRRAKHAIDKFNCYAEGSSVCF
jgi:hypothetical protein